MISILPRPKFSLKWKIDIINAPKDWVGLIENSVIWTLAQERRYRDCFLTLKVRFVSYPYMQKMLAKTFEDGVQVGKQLVFKHEIKIQKSRDEVMIGEIVCCSALLFQEMEKQGKKNLFEFIVRECLESALRLLFVPERAYPTIRRTVLAKFGLY